MVKGEIAHRPKPTKEQVRVAQITQDGQTVNDPMQLNKIRKVMELTRCSEIDADFALHDSANDVEQAVLMLLENGSTWKESKGRKTKKQETTQRDEQSRRTDSSKGPANRGKGGSYQGKGNYPPRNTRDGQDFKPKDRQQSNQGPRGNGNPRGNKPAPNQKDNEQSDMQKFPPISSFNNDFPNTEEDNTWKNGPLVFEKSAAAAPNVSTAVSDSFTPTPSISTTKGEKLTFAAVAASKKPVQAVQPVVTSTASSLLHPESQQPTTAQSDEISLKSETKDAASPSNARQFTSAASDGRVSPVSLVTNSVPSTSFGPTVVSNLNVNKEFTDQLKNDIGLGSSPISNTVVSQASISSVAVITPNASQQSSMDTGNSVLSSRPSALLHDVEFVSGDHSSSITDFQFGFHSEAPNAQVDSLLSDRSMNKSRDASAALSYMNTCNVEYQSNDLRLSGTSANNSVGSKTNNVVPQPSQSQPTQQQLSQPSSGPQQPSAQQQHNASLQQQQQQMYAAAAAPFPGYGFPYLYSPVAASNMRDVEQLNNYAALSGPFPYGINTMNQLDMQLSALSLPPSMQPSVPQQSQQQHRSSVADNKFPPTNANPTNGLQGANSYQSGLGGVGTQSGHQMRGQAASDNGTAGGASGGVAPPPGFSGPPFLTQPSFQSLFQLPNYSHPGQMSVPYFLQGNATQQRQPQNQHPAQQPNMHQQHQRLVEQNSYLDMKYPQHQSGGANANNGAGNNVGGMPPSANFGQGPQPGRNGGGLDNSQYYNQSKWGAAGNWRSS